MGIVIKVGAELKVVTVLDPHFSPQQTPMRKTDFLEEAEDAFRQAIAFGASVGARLIVMAGDIFHLKTATKNPHWFVNRVLQLLHEAAGSGMMVVGIGGNHDLTFGSLKYLWNQPLGTLILGRAIHLLDGNPVRVEAEGFSVRVAGCSFNHSSAEGTRSLKKEGDTFLVGVGHFWFGPKSGEFFGEPIFGPDYLSQSEVDAYVIGHHHEDQGIVKSGGKTYFVHGSMSRTGMHEGDLKRHPAIGLMTITKEGVVGQVVRLRARPAEEIFDLTMRQQVKDEEKKLREFIEALATQGFGKSVV